LAGYSNAAIQFDAHNNGLRQVRRRDDTDWSMADFSRRLGSEYVSLRDMRQQRILQKATAGSSKANCPN
jgi:hypothetical protein